MIYKKSFARRIRETITLAGFLGALSGTSLAQQSKVTQLDFVTGSQFEDYLRVLQVAGIAPLYPWSTRGFSPRVIERLASADSTGPWALKQRLNLAHISVGSINPTVIFNSAYPYGSNDGPLWAGRGLTVAISGGVAGKFGPLSFTLAPMAFRAGNTAFNLLPNGRSGALAFNNASFPDVVDYPQRFGDGAYSRLDPGNSTIRFDSRFVAFGLSTANEWIGPATEYPFLLSNNAPGFPHIFIESGDAINLWIARIQPRVMWGKLYQSDYSPVTGSTHFISAAEPGTERLMTSAQISILPRGVPGLEVGFARFFHVPYRVGEPSGSFWKKPFKVFFLKNEYAQGDSVGADNQLASAFFRWVFPHSGFELYGERGYEDQFYDLRDFIQDPDNEREYMLGFQKILRRSTNTLDVLKAELINYQLPTLARVRVQGLVYVHGILRQGHTNRGQLLGASAGVGAAAASTISWTRYSSRGRSSFLLRRIVRDQRNDFAGNGTVSPGLSDVIVSAGVERMRFGRRADFGAKAEVMQDFNRNFAKDVPNLNLQLTARLHSW